ncbi:hypothetical protein AWB83_02813 [Caballeronia ptereochthonis]|uniref:Uncharacterized protein n=1 Tax=Caballeronia ptereochthonis TaxID=1777144 RepID=A0A158B5J9_9BURK|nr:hypothetical protein AWB83_02813 [Caballeronia ptereochthonis]
MVASVPPLFDSAPVSIESVPVPELVIFPWSFTIAAGVRLKSCALVAIVPLALSSMPVTASAVAPVPLCTMLPLRFVRFDTLIAT